MIRRTLWRLLLEQGGWSRIWYGLATAMVIAGGGLIYNQTRPSGTPPPPPAEGWLLTTSNIGLAPFGLTCSGLPAYTGTYPIPAGTHIYRQRLDRNGFISLDAGGIVIEQSCIQQTGLGGGTPDRMVTSFTPPNPNVIKDSEVDGSLIGQQEVSKACALRGIWQEISRTYVHNVGSGICKVDYDDTITTSTLVESNLITHLVAYGDGAGAGSHNEAATERCNRIDIDPNRTTIWRGNWIDTNTGPQSPGASNNDSAGFFIQTTFGCPIGNLYIEDNYMTDPANYDLFADGSGYSGDRVLTNNRFGPNGFGPCSVIFSFTSQSGNFNYNASNPPTYAGSSVSC